MVRVKSRYLLCEVMAQGRSGVLRLTDRAVAAAVKEAVARIHGDYGAALCSIRFSVKYMNVYTGIVMLRFPKSCYKLLWSALPFITSIESEGHKVPCFLNCLHVGGTIRTCQKFLIRYNTKQLQRMLSTCKNEEERKEIRRSILSCTLIQGKKGALEEEEEEDEEEDEEEQ